MTPLSSCSTERVPLSVLMDSQGKERKLHVSFARRPGKFGIRAPNGLNPIVCQAFLRSLFSIIAR